VTLTATGDAATYAWALGDGATAEGAQVTHTYGPGRFVATVTATGASGEVAQAQVAVSSIRQVVTLSAPRVADHGDAVVVRGTVRPAGRTKVGIYRSGTHVTTVRSRAGGRFQARIRVLRPGTFEARVGATRSHGRALLVRPRLEAVLAPTAALGTPLTAVARVVPRGAGTIRVSVRRDGRVVRTRSGRLMRVRLPTDREARLSLALVTRPRPGYLRARRVLTARVVVPSLGYGARGPSVLALEQRLRELRFAIRGADSLYAGDTLEAVLAFQKVHGLPRTGRVDAGLWRRLVRAGVPKPRFGGGNRIEVDKTRQVLFEVAGGEVVRVVHVSTGATGNTPLGRWQVYRKVPGFDWVLWYPLYFLRGFAIHGYPSVPAYPASHGCVRVPMWIAPSLYARHGHGATIVVYA
jgi:L,D-transpeptidase catalytic domain/PKD domain/Putative peptidoglycan binding domain